MPTLTEKFPKQLFTYLSSYFSDYSETNWIFCEKEKKIGRNGRDAVLFSRTFWFARNANFNFRPWRRWQNNITLQTSSKLLHHFSCLPSLNKTKKSFSSIRAVKWMKKRKNDSFATLPWLPDNCYVPFPNKKAHQNK